MPEENIYHVMMDKFYRLPPNVRAILAESPEFLDAIRTYAPTDKTVSIFGTTAPAAPTTHTDAELGSWFSQMFYVPFAGDTLANALIVGARLCVPIGSSHIGQTWRAGLVRLTGPDVVNDTTFGGQAQYESNGTKIEGAPLVAGWNEVAFAVEHPGVANGEAFMIGVQIGDGTRYIHVGAGMTTELIRAGSTANFVLAENDVRSWYRDVQQDTALWYGIDVKVKIP